MTTTEESYAAKAASHVLEAEKRAAVLDGIDEATAEDLRHVGIIGAGTMGLGIAISVLNSGRVASVVDRSEEVLLRGRAYIATYFAGQVQKGRVSEADAEERQMGLVTSTRMDSLADADLVIEAVFEDYVVKEAVLADIAAHVRADAIIATNTSALNANLLAASVSYRARFVGLHFFSPANIMRLVEVVRCDVTSDATLARSFALVKALGKLPVLAGVCDGFIGNRMYAKYNAAANDLVNMGAAPEQIDAALERFGVCGSSMRGRTLRAENRCWLVSLRIRVARSHVRSAGAHDDRPMACRPWLPCPQHQRRGNRGTLRARARRRGQAPAR